MPKTYLVLLLSLVTSITCFAQSSEHSWPVPDVPNLLFYLQRDPDSNTVVYTLNTDEAGEIIEDDPIKMFWIKYTEGGIHKPLTLIQKDLAYGLSVKPQGNAQYTLHSVAYPKMQMQLQKGSDGKYNVTALLDKHHCILKRIYIRITGGSHLYPDVAYLEFHGSEISTGKAISERVVPN